MAIADLNEDAVQQSNWPAWQSAPIFGADPMSVSAGSGRAPNGEEIDILVNNAVIGHKPQVTG